MECSTVLRFPDWLNAVVAPLPVQAARRLQRFFDPCDCRMQIHPGILHIELFRFQKSIGGLPSTQRFLSELQEAAAQAKPVCGYSRELSTIHLEAWPDAERWLMMKATGVPGLWDLRTKIAQLARAQGLPGRRPGDPKIFLGQLAIGSPDVSNDKAWAWVNVDKLWVVIDGQMQATIPMKVWRSDERGVLYRAQRCPPRPIQYIH